MAKLRDELTRLSEEFAVEIVKALRSATLEELSDVTADRGSPRGVSPELVRVLVARMKAKGVTRIDARVAERPRRRRVRRR